LKIIEEEKNQDEIMRILFDTNTLISAVIANGKPRKLLLMALANEFDLVSSNELLKEFENVISRPKFKLSSLEINKFVNTVRKTVKIVKVKSDFKVVKDDPEDDKVLNASYDAKVVYIVTGDSDLLKLKKFKGIKIVTASKLLKLLEFR